MEVPGVPWWNRTQKPPLSTRDRVTVTSRRSLLPGLHRVAGVTVTVLDREKSRKDLRGILNLRHSGRYFYSGDPEVLLPRRLSRYPFLDRLPGRSGSIPLTRPRGGRAWTWTVVSSGSRSKPKRPGTGGGDRLTGTPRPSSRGTVPDTEDPTPPYRFGRVRRTRVPLIRPRRTL